MPGVRSELILASSGAEVRNAVVVITKAVKRAIEEVMFKKSGRHVPIRFLASHFHGGTCKSLSHLSASFSREDL